jgi:hypothetical protein
MPKTATHGRKMK